MYQANASGGFLIPIAIYVTILLFEAPTPACDIEMIDWCLRHHKETKFVCGRKLQVIAGFVNQFVVSWLK